MLVNTEVCALLEYYAAYSGDSLPKFRDNLSLTFSRALTLGLLKQLVLLQLVRNVHILWKQSLLACSTLRALNRVNPVHDRPSYSQEFQLNSILSFTPRSSKWPLSFKFPHQSHVRIYILPITGHILRFSSYRSVKVFVLGGFNP